MRTVFMLFCRANYTRLPPGSNVSIFDVCCTCIFINQSCVWMDWASGTQHVNVTIGMQCIAKVGHAHGAKTQRDAGRPGQQRGSKW